MSRIEQIIELCPAHRVWADIGCDHGYTAIGLVKSGRAEKAIAIDVSAPSLQKARDNVRKAGIAANVELREGSGLLPLGAGEADGAVISGMGAMQIIKIISAQMEKAWQLRHMVLLPNNLEQKLRAFLLEHGFEILKERIIKEGGKYYQMMLVTKGHCEAYEEGEMLVGRKVEPAHIFLEYLTHRIASQQKIVDQIEAAGANADSARHVLAALKQRGEDEI